MSKITPEAKRAAEPLFMSIYGGTQYVPGDDTHKGLERKRQQFYEAFQSAIDEATANKDKVIERQNKLLAICKQEAQQDLQVKVDRDRLQTELGEAINRHNALADSLAEARGEVERKKNLALRCFDSFGAEDELFEKVQVILGGRPVRECIEPDYKWLVLNTWTDSYDSSVEVVIAPDAPPMTREQADIILALGFDCIFESQDERGVRWSKAHNEKCSPRTADENRHRELKAIAERNQAEKARDELVGLKIQGKSLRDYLTEQFPATIGHVPLREYFDRLDTLLAALNAATREGE